MNRTVIAAAAGVLLLPPIQRDHTAQAQDARVRALILVGSFAAGAIIGSTGVQAKKKEKEEAEKKEEARKASLALQEFAKRLEANTAAAKEAEEARKRSELLSSFAKGRFRVDPSISIYNTDLWKNPPAVPPTGRIKSGLGTPPPPSPQFKLPDSQKNTATAPPPTQFKLPDSFKATPGGSPLTHNLYTTQTTFHVYKLGTGWHTTAQHCISFGTNKCYPCDLHPGIGLGAVSGQCVMRLGEAAIDMSTSKLSR
jgi:hypothetical protein